MLNTGYQYPELAPWLSPSGCGYLVTVLGLNFLGDDRAWP
jgi:hypothetical protein